MTKTATTLQHVVKNVTTKLHAVAS